MIHFNKFGLPARGRMMTTARYLFDVGLYGVSRIRHRATNIAVNTLSIFISSVDAENKPKIFGFNKLIFFLEGGGEEGGSTNPHVPSLNTTEGFVFIKSDGRLDIELVLLISS